MLVTPRTQFRMRAPGRHRKLLRSNRRTLAVEYSRSYITALQGTAGKDALVTMFNNRSS